MGPPTIRWLGRGCHPPRRHYLTTHRLATLWEFRVAAGRGDADREQWSIPVPCRLLHDLEYRLSSCVTEQDPSTPFGDPPGFHGLPLAWNGSTFCVFRNFVLQKDSARASPPNLHGPKFMIDGRTPSDEGVRIYDSLLVCDDSPGGLSLDDHNLALFCVP